MRQFSWNVFSKTGNVESYLLFKELERNENYDLLDEEEEEKMEEESDLFI